MVISPSPSLIAGDWVLYHRLMRKRLAPAMEVLRCLYISVSRALCSQRQNGLPGLGKVWEPTPVVGNHRKVTRKCLV